MDSKVADFPVASALTGTEKVPVIQGGVDKITTTQAIANLGGSSSGVQTIKKSLTAAQIKTGNSIMINSGIPNPGPGKYIKVIKADVNFTEGGTPFDTGGSFLISFQSSTPASDKLLFFGTSDVSDGLSFFYPLREGTNLVGAVLVANSPVYVGLNNDSTVGDGSADIYLQYIIVTL